MIELNKFCCVKGQKHLPITPNCCGVRLGASMITEPAGGTPPSDPEANDNLSLKAIEEPARRGLREACPELPDTDTTSVKC